MPSQKRRKLESAVTAIQQRYGQQAVRKATELNHVTRPPAISSSFAAVDELTGCKGLPLNAISILSGPPTSGKLTLAYKTLATAQQKGDTVMILDLHQNSDPDYLARCGLDLETLYLVRPAPEQTVPLLLDLVKTRKLRLILVDSLPDILMDQQGGRALRASLDTLCTLLRGSGCALLLMDEPEPLWKRWLSDSRAVARHAALHVGLKREQWLYQQDRLVGYRAVVHLLKSRWTTAKETAAIEIVFNGTVKAREVW